MPNAIIERQKIRIDFDDPDMDFVFSWILGAGVITGFSPGELFFLTQRIREGDPASWREAFRAHGDFLSSRAQNVNRADYLAATFAYRAAIEYCDPTTEAYAPLLGAMKDAFAKVVRAAIMRGPKNRSLRDCMSRALFGGGSREPGAATPVARNTCCACARGDRLHIESVHRGGGYRRALWG